MRSERRLLGGFPSSPHESALHLSAPFFYAQNILCDFLAAGKKCAKKCTSYLMQGQSKKKKLPVEKLSFTSYFMVGFFFFMRIFLSRSALFPLRHLVTLFAKKKKDAFSSSVWSTWEQARATATLPRTYLLLRRPDVLLLLLLRPEEAPPQVCPFRGQPTGVGRDGPSGASPGEAGRLPAVRPAGHPPALLRGRRHPGQAEPRRLQLQRPLLPPPEDGRGGGGGPVPLLLGCDLHPPSPRSPRLLWRQGREVHFHR